MKKNVQKSFAPMSFINKLRPTTKLKLMNQSFETASEDEALDEDIEEKPAEIESVKSEEIEKRGRGRPELIFTGQPGRPKKLYASATELLNSVIEVPKTLSDALNSGDAPEWTCYGAGVQFPD